VYWVYIVRCADNTLYSGSTSQLERRMLEHNEGKGAKYTRGRRPVILQQAWMVENRSQALQLEAFLKKFSKQDKESFISEPNLFLLQAKEKGYFISGVFVESK
jgi:putative endonuclease